METNYSYDQKHIIFAFPKTEHFKHLKGRMYGRAVVLACIQQYDVSIKTCNNISVRELVCFTHFITEQRHFAKTSVKSSQMLSALALAESKLTFLQSSLCN